MMCCLQGLALESYWVDKPICCLDERLHGPVL